MEEKRLIEAIHGAIFNKDVKGIKDVKDFYKHATNDIDISKLKLDIIKEQKEVFEWILQHPEYNFNALFEGYYIPFYSNKELFNYFNVYYQKIVFTLDKYNKKEFVIKLKDL